MNTTFRGLYTLVSHVPVASPQELRTDPVDELLVFSLGYFQEIAADLADVRANGLKLTSLLEVL